MKVVTVSSPAKLNLYLRVLKRNRDGYHSLVTVFHRISLKDTLRLKKTDKGISLYTDHPKLPTDDRNIVTQAYDLLKRKFPRLGGVRVYLKKRIPTGAGLGGGSSNAAFFLLGMKKLYHLKISRRELVRMGKKLGADVPFFLYETNQAIAKARGDKIYPQPLRSRCWFLLILSDKGVSTKSVYENLHVRGPAPSLTKVSRVATMLCHFLDRKDMAQVANLLKNDLEGSAFCLWPSIPKSLVRLEKLGVKGVRMSGSGPTVFAVFPHKREADNLFRKMRNALPAKKMAVVHSC